jgi:predicted nucleotidyltransferase
MNHMSQKRNIELEIILQLLREPSHVRALAKTLNQSHATLSRKLSALLNENILDFKTQGKNKTFSLKKNLHSRNFIYKAEHHKLIKAIKEYPKLSIILNDILKSSKEKLIILFGSHAKSSAKKESDIDIYIETKNKETKEQVEKINSKIKVKIGEFDLDSNLIKEIIKDHIILKGVEEFYEKTKFFD